MKDILIFSPKPKARIETITQSGMVKIKGDPFTYEDFTEAQIEEFKSPATDAAQLVDRKIAGYDAKISEVDTAIQNADQKATLANSAAETANAAVETINGTDSDLRQAEILRAGAESARETAERNRQTKEGERQEAEQATGKSRSRRIKGRKNSSISGRCCLAGIKANK